MTALRRVGAVVAVALGAASCGAAGPREAVDAGATVEQGTLTACVAETPRLVVPTGDGGYEGYDVEALRAVADALELDLELVATGFDDLVSGTAVNEGRCDIGAGGIVPGGDLDQLVDVTAPYRQVDRLVVAPAGAATADVASARVGVEQDGPASDALDALDAAEVVPAPSLADLVRFLEVGDVDAVMVPPVEVAVVEETAGEVVVVARIPTGDRTVMVLPRGTDEPLRTRVDEALTAFVDGDAGTEADERWLGG